MDLISNLKAFNRKERFILLHETLGFQEESFRLGDAFRIQLHERLRIAIPKDAFVAMDYHLDWLQMAMYLIENPRPEQPIHNDDMVVANQEDVDLLVCFSDGPRMRLVLIEAKSDTPWSNKQLCSKANRLDRIFGEGRPGTKSVIPSFVMMSPTESKRLKTCSWPEWMRPGGEPIWLPLSLPDGLMKPTRCNEAGETDENGNSIRLQRSRR